MDTKWYIENGERLARIESALKVLSERKPCADCQNEETIVRMKTNLRIINWVGSALTLGALTKLGQWVVENLTTPFQ